VIDIVIATPGGPAIDRAEADTPETALAAAAVLWDESLADVQGERRVARFYVGGRLVRETDRRPSA
jgi:hypothetical protein